MSDKCTRCALFTGISRCSFNRLIRAAIGRDLVLDYVETPTHIRIVCSDTTFYCDPEEAHFVLCDILRTCVSDAGDSAPAIGDDRIRIRATG